MFSGSKCFRVNHLQDLYVNEVHIYFGQFRICWYKSHIYNYYVHVQPLMEIDVYILVLASLYISSSCSSNEGFGEIYVSLSELLLLAYAYNGDSS